MRLSGVMAAATGPEAGFSDRVQAIKITERDNAQAVFLIVAVVIIRFLDII
jgi:hypothetical protein